MALFPRGTFPFPLFHQKSKRKEILEAYALLPIWIELFYYYTACGNVIYDVDHVHIKWPIYIYIYIWIYLFLLVVMISIRRIEKIKNEVRK